MCACLVKYVTVLPRQNNAPLHLLIIRLQTADTRPRKPRQGVHAPDRITSQTRGPRVASERAKSELCDGASFASSLTLESPLRLAQFASPPLTSVLTRLVSGLVSMGRWCICIPSSVSTMRGHRSIGGASVIWAVCTPPLADNVRPFQLHRSWLHKVVRAVRPTGHEAGADLV
jgi:hypothetical protein